MIVELVSSVYFSPKVTLNTAMYTTLKWEEQRRSVGYCSYPSIFFAAVCPPKNFSCTWTSCLNRSLTKYFSFLFITPPFVEILPLAPFSSNWSRAAVSMHLVWQNPSFALHQGRCCAEYKTAYTQIRKRRQIKVYFCINWSMLRKWISLLLKGISNEILIFWYFQI